MIPLVQLKKEVQFNTEFTQSVDIMKGIAMSRFFTLQRKLARFEPFPNAVEELLSVVDWDTVSHPFVHSRSDRVGARRTCRCCRDC